MPIITEQTPEGAVSRHVPGKSRLLRELATAGFMRPRFETRAVDTGEGPQYSMVLTYAPLGLDTRHPVGAVTIRANDPNFAALAPFALFRHAFVRLGVGVTVTETADKKKLDRVWRFCYKMGESEYDAPVDAPEASDDAP